MSFENRIQNSIRIQNLQSIESQVAGAWYLQNETLFTEKKNKKEL